MHISISHNPIISLDVEFSSREEILLKTINRIHSIFGIPRKQFI